MSLATTMMWLSAQKERQRAAQIDQEQRLNAQVQAAVADRQARADAQRRRDEEQAVRAGQLAGDRGTSAPYFADERLNELAGMGAQEGLRRREEMDAKMAHEKFLRDLTQRSLTERADIAAQKQADISANADATKRELAQGANKTRLEVARIMANRPVGGGSRDPELDPVTAEVKARGDQLRNLTSLLAQDAKARSMNPIEAINLHPDILGNPDVQQALAKYKEATDRQEQILARRRGASATTQGAPAGGPVVPLGSPPTVPPAGATPPAPLSKEDLVRDLLLPQ